MQQGPPAGMLEAPKLRIVVFGCHMSAYFRTNIPESLLVYDTCFGE
jgi:hypothetical protein